MSDKEKHFGTSTLKPPQGSTRKVVKSFKLCSLDNINLIELLHIGMAVVALLMNS